MTNEHSGLDEAEKSPFEVLGVPLDADDRTIRREYAKLLREVRSRGDTLEIQEVQQAFEAIRDEGARIALRKTYESSDVVGRVLQEANEALFEEDFDRANALFRQLLEDAPESEQAILAFVDYQRLRERPDKAFRVAQRLLKLRPDHAIFHRLAAQLLFEVSDSERQATNRNEQRRLAIKYLRKARSLGDDSAENLVLESRILWSQDRRQLATSVLLDRLNATNELHTEELRIAVELLDLHGRSGGGHAVRDVLDRIAVLLPEDDDRRRTIAHALCGLASSLQSSKLPMAIECADTAELCLPDDSEVREFASGLRAHREELATRVEEEIRHQEVVLPASDHPNWWRRNWWLPVVGGLVLKTVFLLNSSGDSTSSPGFDPDLLKGRFIEILDSKGEVIETIPSDELTGKRLSEIMREEREWRFVQRRSER